MKCVDKEFDIKFTIPRNSFIKGKHPDVCPDCKEEPILQDVNAPYVNSELWIAQCKCDKPHVKAVTGDTIEETVSNWDKMIKTYKERTK